MNKLSEKLKAFLLTTNSNEWPAITVAEEPAADPETVTLSLTINNDLSYLKGHFPDKPVVPGVVQVHWANLLACDLFGITQSFTKMENVKFQSMILPEQTLLLSLRNNIEKQYIAFHYRLSDTVVSEGKLYFHG